MEERREGKNSIKDQRGFTFVELLISVVILSIVVTAVCGFIIVGSKSYAAANTEIMLQQEAQLALNQISDVVIDTTRSVNYAGYDAGGNPVLVEKDSDFMFSPQDKSLTLFNGTEKQVNPDGSVTIESGGGNDKNYQFYWNSLDERLYYAELDLDRDLADFPMSEAAGQVLLAEHVTDFSVDLTQVVEKRVVQISMTFSQDNRIYTTSNNITIRNKVQINDIDLEALDRRVVLNVVPKEPLVILEPGEDYQFSTPQVTGLNILDKSVTWSLSGETPHDAGTVFLDEKNGMIHISSSEMETSFKVVITTNATDSEGNHGTGEVTVQVKRAKTVSLIKSADDNPENSSSEVSPGKTFTISAKVEGNKLGVSCGGCDDDVTDDKYVIKDEYPAYSWQVVRGANLVTMMTGDNGFATFKVSENAKKNDEIEIQATSLLSLEKGYTLPGGGDGAVSGTIVLKVAQPKDADLSLGGEIRYGKATSIGIKNPNFNQAGQGYYIVCARIKTDLNAPVSTDRVMLYSTNGADTWMTPDLFGLDLNGVYYISLQLLDQGCHLSGADDPVIAEVVEEYNNNLDSSGVYIGTKYEATDQLTFTLYSPQIVYEYDGLLYEGKPVTLETLYAAEVMSNGRTATISCRVVKVSNAMDETMDAVSFRVYEGTGDDLSGWTFKYGCRDGYHMEGNAKIGGLDFSSITNPKDLQVKLEQNNTMQAVGTYHYVPYFKYENKPPADHTYTVYYKNFDPDYTEHIYERPDSAIHYTIKGGNINLWAYADNSYTKGIMYFPSPSDNSWNGFTKYFKLQETSLQTVQGEYGFQLFDANNNRKNVVISKMTCQYIKNTDSYELQLFYKAGNLWGSTTEISAGKFKCAANGTEWERVSFGTADAQLESGQQPQLDGSNA